MIKTRVTELFGIEHPIVQGGMLRVSRAELVAAVSNAGALGTIAALTFPTPEELGREIERTRKITDKPFAVNLTILPTLKPVPYDEYAQVIIESGVKIVETAGRSPRPFLPGFKGAGIKVIHKCTSVRHGLKAEKLSCDAVSIDGFECAGHPGEDDIPGLILIPRAADEIQIPIIASGGFGDGRGLAAALALGAEGVNMGTRFLAVKETPIHDKVKKVLVKATELETVLIYRSLRNTARMFKNSVAGKVLEIEGRGNATIEDLAPYVSGDRSSKVFETGDMEAGVWTMGLVAGLINDIPTAKDLVQRIVTEAEEIIKSRLTGLII